MAKCFTAAVVTCCAHSVCLLPPVPLPLWFISGFWLALIGILCQSSSLCLPCMHDDLLTNFNVDFCSKASEVKPFTLYHLHSTSHFHVSFCWLTYYFSSPGWLKDGTCEKFWILVRSYAIRCRLCMVARYMDRIQEHNVKSNSDGAVRLREIVKLKCLLPWEKLDCCYLLGCFHNVAWW